jgi:VCBS repeat-containing protein
VTTISTTIDIDLDFSVTVRDGDGDALSFPIHVDIVNGAPSAGVVTALIDEDSLANGVAGGLGDTAGTATASGTLAFSFGPDGPAGTDPVNFSPMHNLSVVDTGNVAVTSAGAALSYYWDSATDTLYGSTNISSAANALATAAFKVTLNTSNGDYQYTQIKPIDHPGHDDPSSPATELSYEDTIAIALRYQVKDANGDSAQGTLTVSVNDDTPVANNDTGTLNVVVDDLGVSSIVAKWTNVVMTSGTADQFDRDGDGASDEIRWGEGSTSTDSGYGFVDNAALLNTPVQTNETFSLGTFTHFNFPVSLTSTLSTTTLAVTFTAVVNGEPVLVGPILINFTHTETPNTGTADQNRDIISISTTTTTVNIDGQNYTLDVRGFVDGANNIVSTVRTYENQSNSYALAVRFVSSDTTEVTQTGNVISNNDLPGADGGLAVVAIARGASTDASADGSNNFEMLGQYGKLTINKDGGYSYVLTVDGASLPATGASDVFTYTVADADGDRKTADLTINLSKSDGGENFALNDRVITNISGGAGTNVVISEAALLHNDDSGTTVTGSATNVSDATSANRGSGNFTFIDNDSDGGKFTYAGQSGALSDQAVVTVDRSQINEATLDGTILGDILIGRSGVQDTILGGAGDDVLMGQGGGTQSSVAASITADGSTEDSSNSDFLRFRFTDGTAGTDFITSITINLQGGDDSNAVFDPAASSGSSDYGPTLTNLIGLSSGDISGLPTTTEPGSITMNFAAGTFGVGDGFDLNIDVDSLGNESDAGEFADEAVTATITFADGRTQTVIFSSVDGNTSVANFALAGNGDTLDGGTGDDWLIGAGGGDLLIGGDGSDKMTGGTGADTFVISADAIGSINDVITDFNPGQGDQIDLSELLSGIAAGTNLETSGYVSIVQVGANAEVRVDTNGGANSFQTVAVLENYTAVNEAVKVLFQDNAGTKHQDNI